MLDDSKYLKMAENFPRDVHVALNKKLYVTRRFFRNFYFLAIIGGAGLFFWKQPQLFKPYAYYPTTV